jgi:hypothetical protein
MTHQLLHFVCDACNFDIYKYIFIWLQEMEPLCHIMVPFNTIFTDQSNLSSFIRCSLIHEDYEGI